MLQCWRFPRAFGGRKKSLRLGAPWDCDGYDRLWSLIVGVNAGDWLGILWPSQRQTQTLGYGRLCSRGVVVAAAVGRSTGTAEAREVRMLETQCLSSFAHHRTVSGFPGIVLRVAIDGRRSTC